MSQHPPTLESLVSQIEIAKPRTIDDTSDPREVTYHKKWDQEEQKILVYLMRHYGCDFTFMKKFLPFKTRKQIQRRYELLAKRDLEVYERAERRDRKEQRKAHFDL